MNDTRVVLGAQALRITHFERRAALEIRDLFAGSILYQSRTGST